MSDLFFKTMKRLEPALRRGDLVACEREVARRMEKLPRGPFHIVLDLSITNEPRDAAAHFDDFFSFESERFQIGAAYTEMNGFDINPNRWYCDLFAYSADGGGDEHDWLSDWQSERFEEYEITGLEPLQEVYASDAFGAKENRDASYMSSMMVVVKFQGFMQRAASRMKLLRFPLYVTAHEFDFIAIFDPRAESERTPVRKLSIEQQVDELIGKLRDADSHIRFRAATKLWMKEASAKRAVPALIQLLSDVDPATRQAAATALSKIDPTSDAVVSEMVRCLDRDPLPIVRQAIVRALGYSPTKAATAALTKAIFDEDRVLRRYAVISLKLLGKHAKEAAPAIKKLLETETDREIRSQAGVALKLMLE